MSVSGPNAAQNTRGIFSFVRQIRTPKLGELRDPITIFRSERKPVLNPDGSNTYMFSQEVTPYYSCWCKMYQYQGLYLDGQNTEENLSHIFLIRRVPEIVIESRSYIVWQGKIFTMRGIRSVEDVADIVKEGVKYDMLLTNEFGIFNEEERVVLDNQSPDLGTPATPLDDNNPLWR